MGAHLHRRVDFTHNDDLLLQGGRGSLNAAHRHPATFPRRPQARGRRRVRLDDHLAPRRLHAHDGWCAWMY